MSDSPIESTKGLHESKERKPEMEYTPCNVPMMPDRFANPALCTMQAGHKGRHSFEAMPPVALPRGAEPETDCDCEGLWNDSTIRMGPEQREVYNRTGHLPNCPNLVPPRGEAETPTDTELTEREIRLTVLAVMDALDANTAFRDDDPEEYKRIIQKLQRKAKRCVMASEGWYCSRAAGHEGPCAARQITPTLGQDWVSRVTTSPDAD